MLEWSFALTFGGGDVEADDGHDGDEDKGELGHVVLDWDSWTSTKWFVEVSRRISTLNCDSLFYLSTMVHRMF